MCRYRNGFLPEKFEMDDYLKNNGGIRHANVSDEVVDMDLALYIFVSCSAFVNYLLVKAKNIESTVKNEKLLRIM